MSQEKDFEGVSGRSQDLAPSMTGACRLWAIDLGYFFASSQKMIGKAAPTSQNQWIEDYIDPTPTGS